MNQKVLQTLEFDKIINILTGYATTELGKLMCANLKPMTEEADILNAQDQTQDALTRIYKRGNVSFCSGICKECRFLRSPHGRRS